MNSKCASPFYSLVRDELDPPDVVAASKSGKIVLFNDEVAVTSWEPSSPVIRVVRYAGSGASTGAQ